MLAVLSYVHVPMHALSGGIALDPASFKTPNPEATMEAYAVHNACVKVGQLVGDLQPDILLLSTPHGVADLTQFSFYLNSKVREPFTCLV